VGHCVGCEIVIADWPWLYVNYNKQHFVKLKLLSSSQAVASFVQQRAVSCLADVSWACTKLVTNPTFAKNLQGGAVMLICCLSSAVDMMMKLAENMYWLCCLSVSRVHGNSCSTGVWCAGIL